jgi:hypothetical protein
MHSHYECLNKLKLKVNTMSKWISVNDRLPNSFGWFLVIDEYLPSKEKQTMGFYECSDSLMWLPIDGRADSDSMKITHWMPLPEPPKE